MAEKYGSEGQQPIWAVIGLHPVHTYSQHLDEEETSFRTREEHFNTLEYESLAKSPKVVGIGECGLDYYRIKSREAGSGSAGIEDPGLKIEEVKERQKDAFLKQIQLARALNKALVIHCRPSAGSQDAYEDILKILDVELASRKSLHPFRFEIHSFTGSAEIVEQFLLRGAYVGLNGIITFDKTGNMQKVVEVVPLERVVLETDSPYLTPNPYRGKRNEPSFVKHVAERVAEIKKTNFAEVCKVTTQNAKKLFFI
jgi:TatD DNase family protein